MTRMLENQMTMMRALVFLVEGRAAVAGDTRKQDLLEMLGVAMKLTMQDMVQRAYECPVCGSHDRNAYLNCNRPNCTDGRDL